jgi:hypothetical protein
VEQPIKIDNSDELAKDLYDQSEKIENATYRRASIYVFTVLLLIFLIPSLLIFKLSQLRFSGQLFGGHKESPSIIAEKIQEFKTGDFAVKISEDELGQVLGVGDGQFPLKNAQMRILPDKIVISGKTSASFLSLKVDVSFLPEIADNKIRLKVLDIKSMGVVAPKEVIELIQPQLDQYFSTDHIPLPQNVRLTEIMLYSGYLLLRGII